jgi:hypothetical protein
LQLRSNLKSERACFENFKQFLELKKNNFLGQIFISSFTFAKIITSYLQNRLATDAQVQFTLATWTLTKEPRQALFSRKCWYFGQ